MWCEKYRVEILHRLCQLSTYMEIISCKQRQYVFLALMDFLHNVTFLYFFGYIDVSVHYVDDEGNNTWPEILKFLFDCAGSGNVELKDSALIIFR